MVINNSQWNLNQLWLKFQMLPMKLRVRTHLQKSHSDQRTFTIFHPHNHRRKSQHLRPQPRLESSLSQRKRSLLLFNQLLRKNLFQLNQKFNKFQRPSNLSHREEPLHLSQQSNPFLLLILSERNGRHSQAVPNSQLDSGETV